MERVKDFLYDMSDVVISLLIVAVIFYVVSWKLNESMPIEFTFGDQTSEQGQQETETLSPTEAVTEDTANRPVEENTEAASESSPETTEAPAVTPSGTVQTITITIPSGATGFSIAKALKEKGLITDVNAFIKHVEDLKLGNKLTAGTFKFKTDMTEEQIIKKIANVK